MTDKERLLHREHRWVNVRLIGWGLLGAWQVLNFISEFIPIDLASRRMRLMGHVIGLAGTLMLAVGFERVVETAHRRTGAHP